jgi:hypothetical protein
MKRNTARAMTFAIAYGLTPAAEAASCEEFDRLSTKQTVVLYESYMRGVQHDLGYTLAAIAFHESSAGLFRMNYKSKDFGVFQINIKTAASIEGVTNYFAKTKLAERLLYDDAYNASLAVNVLESFKKQHKGSWKEAVKSYNQGNKWKRSSDSNKIAEKYLASIINKIKMLRKCL